MVQKPTNGQSFTSNGRPVTAAPTIPTYPQQPVIQPQSPVVPPPPSGGPLQGVSGTQMQPSGGQN